MDPGWAAFLGGLAGGLGTLLAYGVQATATRRQQRVSSAAQLAAVDYENEIKLCKTPQATLEVASLSQYVAYYSVLLRRLEKGAITKVDIKALGEEYDVYYETLKAQRAAPADR